MKQIIKGALYFTGDVVLRAHYTGSFVYVDCTEYKTKKQIKEEYDRSFLLNALKGTYITVDGVKYFECEYSPCNTADMDLLSDFEDLEYYDEETEFES